MAAWVILLIFAAIFGVGHSVEHNTNNDKRHATIFAAAEMGCIIAAIITAIF